MLGHLQSGESGGGRFWAGRVGPCVLLLAVYAAGLTHGLSRPWTGMHDWNGAFFSQLARNFLRYPMSMHHGMPVVAVGEAVPPPEERSIYATHPPGLVWLMAMAFQVLGESEWAARFVPVVFSLGALALLLWLVDRRWGRETALLSGLIYGVMPMAVYFGRMVNHEAVCLCLMLGAVAAWQVVVDRSASASRRRWAWVLWAVAVCGAIWVDWSGMLFAGAFAVYAGIEWVRGCINRRAVILAWGVPIIACGGMLAYLVSAGLEGHWRDLVAIFLSRATDVQGDVLLKDCSARGGVWDYTVENLTWPVLVLAIVGLALSVVRLWTQRASGDSERLPGGAFWVVLATGVVWLLVFWRQYGRHNYWSFYVGPAAAVFSAFVLVAVRDWLRSVSVGLADGAMFLALVVMLGFCLRGTDGYFGRVSYPPEEVAAWREVHRRTEPGDRVLLFRNPVRKEQRGRSLFRNLVPPQQAYYLDRAFAVEGNVRAVVGRASRYAAYVIPIKDAVAHRDDLQDVRRRFPESQAFTKLLFDLRAPFCGDEPATAGFP